MHVVTNGEISFFLCLNNVLVCVCVCVCVHIFFIHSLADGPLGCSHVLAAVNNAAKTQGCRYIFRLVLLFSLHKYAEVELLGHGVVLR